MEQKTRISMARRATGLAFISLFLAVFLGAVDAGRLEHQQRLAHLRRGPDRDVDRTSSHRLERQGGVPHLHGTSKQTPEQLAVSPLAFPNMVTPRAVAVLIIFVAFFPAIGRQAHGACRRGTHAAAEPHRHALCPWFMEQIGMTPLLVLGAVFGVLQVALGVEIEGERFGKPPAQERRARGPEPPWQDRQRG